MKTDIFREIRRNGPNGTKIKVSGDVVTVYPDIYNSFALMGPACTNPKGLGSYQVLKEVGMAMTIQPMPDGLAAYKAVSTDDTFRYSLVDMGRAEM